MKIAHSVQLLRVWGEWEIEKREVLIRLFNLDNYRGSDVDSILLIQMSFGIEEEWSQRRKLIVRYEWVTKRCRYRYITEDDTSRKERERENDVLMVVIDCKKKCSDSFTNIYMNILIWHIYENAEKFSAWSTFPNWCLNNQTLEDWFCEVGQAKKFSAQRRMSQFLYLYQCDTCLCLSANVSWYQSHILVYQGNSEKPKKKKDITKHLHYQQCFNLRETAIIVKVNN